jgi:HEAT repeat protein
MAPRSASLILLAAFLFGAAHWCVAAPPEVEQLIKQLRDKDETVRLKAAKELGKLKEKAKDAIPALTAAAEDPDEDVRSVARNSLVAIREAVGGEKLAPLIKDLKARDAKARQAAIAQLEKMGADAKEAGAALVEFGMMSTDPKVREAAGAAFEKIDPTVHKEVVTIFVDENELNRVAAVERLGAMGGKAKASVPAIKGFHEHLLKSSRNVPGFTVVALVAIAPDDASVQKIVLNFVGGADSALPTYFSSGAGVVAIGNRERVIAEMHKLKVDNKQ